VLYTIPNFITAGSGRAMLNVVEGLDRARFEPSVCVFKRGGRLEAEVERRGILLIEQPFAIPARPYHTLWRRVQNAAAPFREHSFDIWHSFHYLDDYTEPLVARAAGARAWVFTKKSMSWHQHSWHLRSLLASGIGAQNSDMMKEFFSSMLYRDKTCLIPPTVDVETYTPSVRTRLDIRSRLGIPGSAVVLSSIAHLIPVKGHPVLILAAASTPNVHLLLAGSGDDSEYGKSLRGQAARLGVANRVHFLGKVDDIPSLLAETDIFALATRGHGHEEGCPVALLEAMSAGRACIATNVAGSRDVIVAGKSGILVPPDDPIALGSAIALLAGSAGERRRLGHAAHLRILENYTIPREVAAYEDLYIRVLKA